MHLSRGIECGENAGYSLLDYVSDSLTIRPRLPLFGNSPPEATLQIGQTRLQPGEILA